jgi:Domain of unknown function (DUF4440)
MMRHFLTILLLAMGATAFGQGHNTRLLAVEAQEFDMALVNKDSSVLGRLLDNALVYAHSSGWVQTKKDVIGDLFNGKITYKQVNSGSPAISMDGDVASVRMTSDLDVEMNGKVVQMKLNVLQVWMWKSDHWELFARQSCKI